MKRSNALTVVIVMGATLLTAPQGLEAKGGRGGNGGGSAGGAARGRVAGAAVARAGSTQGRSFTAGPIRSNSIPSNHVNPNGFGSLQPTRTGQLGPAAGKLNGVANRANLNPHKLANVTSNRTPVLPKNATLRTGLKNSLNPAAAARFASQNTGQLAQRLNSRTLHHAVDRLFTHVPRGHCLYNHRWWLRFACGVHHCYGRNWTCYDGYWNGWQPCSYYYVPCYGIQYYVGMECVLIPDIGCLGVKSVYPNSPAALSGIRPGDVLTSVNGRTLDNEEVLTQEIPNGALALDVMRDGSDRATQLTLAPQVIPSN